MGTRDDTVAIPSSKTCMWCGQEYTRGRTTGYVQYTASTTCSRPCSARFRDSKRKKTVAERFWAKVDKGGASECWEWLAHKYPWGHGQFWPGNNTSTSASRMAYILTYGELSKGLVVRHDCDNPGCCNPGHLRSGTQQDNIDDCRKRGRANYEKLGENHPLAKIDKATLRRLYAEFAKLNIGKGGRRTRNSVAALAQKYGLQVKNLTLTLLRWPRRHHYMTQSLKESRATFSREIGVSVK